MAPKKPLLKAFLSSENGPVDVPVSFDPHHVPSDGWELYIGWIKLAIVGPGEKQWFPCSKHYYSGRVGSDAERETARRAIRILNVEHRNDRTLERPQIDAIIKRAAAHE